MFKNLLVGVDGSEGGRDAIALAKLLGGRDAKVTLAHVHTGRLRPLNVVTPGVVNEEREASGALLERAREEAGLTCELASVEAATPGGGLHREAGRIGADLLVVGSCSRGPLGRAVLGDDTRGALNGASCAVAIAPLGYAEQDASVARIGVAYNRSPESEAALEAARALAGDLRASVELLEVLSIPSYSYTTVIPALMGEGIETVLQEANRRLHELPGVEGRAVYGLPGEELAAFGGKVDLLVVGSRSYGPLKRLVLGSTSSYLAHHARCSLLVLPRGAALPEGAAPERERTGAAAGS